MSASHASRFVRITELHVYPVKSCVGIGVQRARLTAMGFEHDREWMIVRPGGRFVTQRELPKLALIRPTIDSSTLQMSAPGYDPLIVSRELDGPSTDVVVWRDRCKALDAGEAAAAWLERFLGEPLRLVRFDPAFKRPSDRTWTGNIDAFAQFADGFPWLLISEESLQELNGKLPTPLPMDRFRPNIVIAGVRPFEEDELANLSSDSVELRPVKPCTRCAITTTDQQRGERDGDEPLRTLRTFRFNRELKGVTFGQNVVLVEGVGEWLEVGQTLRIEHRTA